MYLINYLLIYLLIIYNYFCLIMYIAMLNFKDLVLYKCKIIKSFEIDNCIKFLQIFLMLGYFYHTNKGKFLH